MNLRFTSLAFLAALLASPALARAEDPPKDASAKPELVAPKLVTFAEATYPPEAMKENLQATVILLLDIDAAGAVTGVTVKEGAGHGFDEAATEAAKRFVFSPATRDGKPIPSRIPYRYAFTLREPTPEEKQAAAPAPTTGRLRGRVLLRDTATPVAGTLVRITGAGPEIVVVTAEDGSWSVPTLSPGRYHVAVAPAGFVPVAADEEVTAGSETDVLYRVSQATETAEVTVKGELPPREVTKRTLEQRELSRIPGTNGDALRALQNMPGVARSAFRGVLIVRGSAPQDTAYFIDGIEVPIVYHFGGLSSVVPTEMIEKLDFYPGNFGAQYGRAMGGIVEVGTLSAGADGKLHGLAQADFIDARMLAQGPISFLPGWTFVVAGRRSYVDVWLKPILSRQAGGVTTAPVYYDWQAFAETHPTSSSRVRVGIYGSDDRLDIVRNAVGGQNAASGSDLELHTGFMRLQGSFENDFGGGVRFRSVLAYGYDLQKFNSGTRSFDQTLHPVQNRSELSMTLAPGYILHVGQDINYTFSRVTAVGPLPRRPGTPDTGPQTDAQSLSETDYHNLLAPAFYSEMEMQLTRRARLVPGFRADYASNSGHWDASPRLSGRYALVEEFPRTTLKGGVGIYHQPPTIRETSAVFGTPQLTSNRAIHYSLGVEQDFTRQVEISVEGFYKDLSNLVARSPAGSESNYDNLGTGYVVGSEVLLRYKPDERFFGWLAYTLSRSTRRQAPSEPQTLFQYDQTHILTVLGSYRIGGGWELGARFRYVSGNLYTPCDGSVQNGSTSSYVCVSGSPFSARLPAFEELDIRVDKHWYYDSWQLSAYLDLINAYNRGNPEGISYNYNFSQQLYQTGLPIIPSLGLRGEF